jgi:hypothetical protein
MACVNASCALGNFKKNDNLNGQAFGTSAQSNGGNTHTTRILVSFISSICCASSKLFSNSLTFSEKQ